MYPFSMHPTEFPVQALILGHDAILAAWPGDPMQLVGACHRLGYDLVVPETWGDEIVAMHVAHLAATMDAPSAIQSSCPFVSEQLQHDPLPARVLRTAPPPVACARYLRAGLSPREVHVTFAGACPGAASAEIDQRLLPDVLLARLVERGIAVSALPRILDAQLPAERARHASVAGGSPDGAWLSAMAGVTLLEAAPVTAAVAAARHDGRVLVDVARASRCICARDRDALARSEPPRSAAPVTRDSAVPVADADRTFPFEREVPQRVIIDPTGFPERAPAPPTEPRVSFAERGFSEVDAEPPQRLTHVLSTALEPWSSADPGLH